MHAFTRSFLAMTAGLALLLSACGGGGGSDKDTQAPVTSANPVGGTYTEAVQVTLSCSDGSGSGCFATFYTTDGSQPTSDSNVYGGAITIDEDTELKFFSVDNADNQEAVRTQSYVISPDQQDEQAPITTASPAGGTFATAQQVSLACDDGAGSGCAATHYTTDGSDPDLNSETYQAPIAIDADTELKFFSVDQAGNRESIRSESYVIDPDVQDDDPPTTSASPAGGTYVGAQQVVLTCNDGGGTGCAATHYTTDGSQPGPGSATYAAPITIDSDSQLKYYSVDQAGNEEQVRTEQYVIMPDEPCDPLGDIDGDGLTDCEEIEGWETRVDRNGDGTVTADEINQVSSSPYEADADQDGLGDQDERAHGTNPNRADTDGDSLNDWDELYRYFSQPTDVDTDDDSTGPDHDRQPNTSLFDGSEINTHHTSPIMADTDGDGYSDYTEITAAGQPLVANLPLIEVSLITDLTVYLNASAEQSCSIQNETLQAAFHRDESRSASSSQAASSFVFDSSFDLHAEAEGSVDGIFPSLSAEVETNASVELGITRESSSSFEQSSMRENSEQYRHFAAQDCFNGMQADDGSISGDLQIRNLRNRSVYLHNMEVIVRKRNPADAGALTSLASINLFTEPEPTTVGGNASQEHHVDVVVPASLAAELLNDPSGLFFTVGNFEMSDEDGRNLSFIQENALNQTGLLELDFGDGRVERYMIATNVERDPNNHPVGINLAQAMTDTLGIDIGTGQTADGVSVLAWVEDQAQYGSDPDSLQYWLVIGSGASFATPDVDFEDIVLEQGDYISLTLLRDADWDGLFDREEAFYGSDPDLVDTDGDMIADRDEVDSARRHPVVPEFPAGQRVAQVANWVPGFPMFHTRRTVALLSNGSLWDMTGIPTRIANGQTFSQVAGGGEQPTWMAIGSDGNLYAWGSNRYGMLGINSADPDPRSEPVMVGQDCGCWAGVAVGGRHVLAIKTDGSLWAWGSNEKGQLGVDGSAYCPGTQDTYACRQLPTQVDAGDWNAVAAGRAHSLAIAADLSLWAWGANGLGQLGLGHNTDQSQPIQVSDNYHRLISAWGDLSMATTESGGDHFLWVFGEQTFGKYASGEHFAWNTPLGLGCQSDVNCPLNSRCMNPGVNGQCWIIRPFVWVPTLFIDGGDMGDPITSISAGPSRFITRSRIQLSGMERYWVPTYSAAWGFNEDGALGLGPGATDTAYYSGASYSCNRLQAELTDPDGNPFLSIQASRGISNNLPEGITGVGEVPLSPGELSVWGNDDDGQLGLGIGGNAQTQPVDVPEFPLP